MEKKNLYLIVADKISQEIQNGSFRATAPLPSCRLLALKLGVNPNTVQKAYNYLEEKQILYSIPKKGYFLNNIELIARKDNLMPIRELKRQGLTYEEVIELVKEVYKEG